MTITDALQLVPEYILLRPGFHKVQAGDAYYFAKVPPFWHEYESDSVYIGETVDGDEVVRRPIPQKVREAMATAIILKDSLSTHALARCATTIAKWLSGGEV